MVTVLTRGSELAAEATALQEGAAAKYASESVVPWPLECLARGEHLGGDKSAMARARREEAEDPVAERARILKEAGVHRRQLADDLRRPQHRDDMVYMFRRLSRLFLEVVDVDLRQSHLQPHQPLGAPLGVHALNEAEGEWRCAPVAEIAEGTRQKCDVCETSIFDRHWACTVPGCEWEVCLQCHRLGERRRAAR
eukprot:3572343-Prymnesium_polylepis.2